MKRFRTKALQSILVLGALAPVLLDGCVSIGVSRAKPAAAETATGSLEVVVVEKSGDKTPTTSKIVTRLVRLESGVEIPVSESTDATWTKTDLPPGRYRLRVSHWIDEKGQPQKFAKTDQESFRLRAGELVQARVVLKAFPTGPVITIAALAGAGILTAILVSALSSWGSWDLGTTRRSEELDREHRERDLPPNLVRAFR